MDATTYTVYLDIPAYGGGEMLAQIFRTQDIFDRCLWSQVPETICECSSRLDQGERSHGFTS